MRRILLVCALALPMALAACGKESGALPGAPEGVSDEEYLVVLCGGIQRFSNALVASSTPEQISTVIRDYAEALKSTVPPRDISRFHQEYIEFVVAAEEQPAILMGGKPPVPPQPARGRIAAKQRGVEACRDMVFFAEPTPTPSR